MDRNYYIGVDIGTNSLGWAVTDENYNLCRFKKKDLWGIRLFESAQTAAERRTKRANRRRVQRRHQRIVLLQELFAEEISKVDPTFFIRLNESRLCQEDKTVKDSCLLFNDSDYSDIDYYEQYPTIFHLRKELIENNQPHDPRLIYLAIHSIIKSRGHFLIEGDLNAAKDFDGIINRLIDAVNEVLLLELYLGADEISECEKVLRDNNSTKSVRAKNVTNILMKNIQATDKDEIKRIKSIINQISAWLVGNKGDISKVLDEETDDFEKKSFKFTDTDYDEVVRENLASVIPDKVHMIDSIKAVYDWSVLVDILDGESYISYAKVKQYDKHRADLAMLRRIIKKYGDKDIYKTFFNDHKGKTNYANYVGGVKKNGKKYAASKCKDEDFFKGLKKILEKISVDDSDEKDYQYLINEAEKMTLLPLQKSKDNSVVPNQIHKAELKAILENAETYLPFLKEISEGSSVSEKILSIFSFRIPYYVGPLSNRHKNECARSWIVRKKEGYIYPWNFEEMVNLEESNQRFIKRMTNKCTYLVGKDVIPRQSILYSKYTVLNELNNLKIRGRKIPIALKKNIFTDLFLVYNKVTTQKLLNYLKGEDSSLCREDLSGFDKEFKSSMGPYLDFKNKVFGERIREEKYLEIAETCIKWITIYGDDKKMLRSMITNHYGGILTEEEIRQICKLRYAGWGNFSKKFLCGIDGVCKETGEVFNIINALWETNDNLMQLMSKNYSFDDEINKYNNGLVGAITEISYNALVKDLYVSPANKRAIWQTIQTIDEIKKIMGCKPKKIFVEMARGEEQNKDRVNRDNNRKSSRKQRLLDLYAACDDDVRKWTEEINKHDERDFNSIKLFLYYTQMGRCMYTGEAIDLDELMSANSRWDRDHIYPQSRIKDDSLDNLVLVKKVVNSRKNNEMLSEDIQKKNISWWKHLLDNGFISKKKYDRLTRTGGFTDEELAGFINRQLVETRQSSKAVAEILDRMYDGAEVVYVKAGLVSHFRKKPLNMLKSRRVNDYHHAKDAYLNIVVGNVYNARFTSNPLEWIRKNRDTNYSINAVFYHDVYRGNQCVWNAPSKERQDSKVTCSTIDTVRSVMSQNNILYTEYTYCYQGQLFDETIANKQSGSMIRLKKNLDPEKYGGYKSANTSYFAVVEFDDKKGKRTKQIIGVPVYIANMLEYDKEAFTSYCKNIKQMKNVKVLHSMIKKNALLSVNGFPMRIRGENMKNIMLKSNVQLVIDEKNEEIVRRIEKFVEKGMGAVVSEKYDGINDDSLVELYDALLDKHKSFYSKRPANQYKTLEAQRLVFIKLDLSSKARVLNQIINMLRCDIETLADLTSIQGPSQAGKISVNKNTLGSSKVVLINQSITGVFVNKMEL